MLTIKELYDSLLSSMAVKSLIPLGYTPGMPMMYRTADHVYIQIPWLRYRMTGIEDRTAVFPVRFVTVHDLADGRMVQYHDLAASEIYSMVDFNKPCGVFRHEAIRHLNREGYIALRSEAYQALDRMIAEPDTDPAQLRTLMTTLIEPSVVPIYRRLNSQFADSFIG